MFRRILPLLALALFMLLFSFTPSTATAASLTPDGVKGWFTAYAAIIMVGWGIVHTRWPALAKLPNDLVPWVNTLLYILGYFVVPAAHAGVAGAVASTASLAWVTASGAATSALTSLFYDKFLKAFLDRFVPKAIPRPA